MRIQSVTGKNLVRAGLAAGWIALAPVDAGLWTSAYYAGWMQWQHLSADEVDFSAMTHVIHFAVIPQADGTLDGEPNGVTADHSADMVARAHAAGTQAIISVGGAGSAPGFRGACSPENLSAFIGNIVTFVTTGIRTAGEDVWITFSSAIGQSYRLQRSPDPGLGSWKNVTEVSATGLTTQVTDAGGAGQPRRFYRVAEKRAGTP